MNLICYPKKGRIIIRYHPSQPWHLIPNQSIRYMCELFFVPDPKSTCSILPILIEDVCEGYGFNHRWHVSTWNCIAEKKQSIKLIRHRIFFDFFLTLIQFFDRIGFRQSRSSSNWNFLFFYSSLKFFLKTMLFILHWFDKLNQVDSSLTLLSINVIQVQA